jgi:hypothetical protein
MPGAVVVKYRPVAEFPLSGGPVEETGGYRVLSTEDQNGEHVHGLPNYSVMEYLHYGYFPNGQNCRVKAGFATFEEAIALCLHNCGWGDFTITRATDD